MLISGNAIGELLNGIFEGLILVVRCHMVADIFVFFCKWILLLRRILELSNSSLMRFRRTPDDSRFSP
jgi:hypothetical protein